MVCADRSMIIFCHSRFSVTKRAFQPDTRTESVLYFWGSFCAASSVCVSTASNWHEKAAQRKEAVHQRAQRGNAVVAAEGFGKDFDVQRRAAGLLCKVGLAVGFDDCRGAAEVGARHRRVVAGEDVPFSVTERRGAAVGQPVDLPAEGAYAGDEFDRTAAFPAAAVHKGRKVVQQPRMPAVRSVRVVAVIGIAVFHIQTQRPRCPPSCFGGSR